MHNIKDIRKNLESFKKDISNRYVDFDSSNFLKLDEENRKLIQEKEKLENEKKPSHTVLLSYQPTITTNPALMGQIGCAGWLATQMDDVGSIFFLSLLFKELFFK